MHQRFSPDKAANKPGGVRLRVSAHQHQQVPIAEDKQRSREMTPSIAETSRMYIVVTASIKLVYSPFTLLHVRYYIPGVLVVFNSVMQSVCMRVIHSRNFIIDPHLLIVWVFCMNLDSRVRPQSCSVRISLVRIIRLHRVCNVLEHWAHHRIRLLFHQLLGGVGKSKAVS